MKKHKTLGIPSLIALCGLFSLSFIRSGDAAGFSTNNMSFGGRVTAEPSQLQTVITCTAAYGPFLILPYNIAMPGPYFIRATTRGTPSLQRNMLALYSTTPDLGTCINPETGVPVPAFEIKLYGVSRR